MNRNLFLAIIFFCICCSVVLSQYKDNTVTVVDTFQVNIENRYKISAVSIIPGSESVFLNNRILEPRFYSISYEHGEVRLSDSLNYRLIDTIYISYRTYLLGLKKEYKRRSLVYRYDETLSDSIRVVQTESSPLTTEAIFGENIQQSGTIVRGFTVGTTKDFTLESGLRLQLSGQLSDEIEIVAALTDENTPIQPEGNTETLEELDKVFIEIRHPNAIGTFGDYDYNEQVGEFGKVERKLQGLKGEALFKNFNAVAAVAGSRGKFTTNQFNGEDGNQGPYRLFGANNEKDIIVIAGSETVFIDGEEMTRGENNDYTIEYANAEITFTPNRLITSATRISVDFEYTDRQYQRNFFAGNVSANLLDDKLNIAVGLFQESDDKNNPIDIVLTDEDKNTLQEAGDDRNNAVKSGVQLAPVDSNGVRSGTYVQVDTTINGETFQYYVYNPGSDSAIYNAAFTYVGSGNGDYRKQSLGHYQFVGIGAGSYLPIRYIPLPSNRQLGNIVLSGNPFENVNLKLELAGSNWDRNTFSSKDDDNNFGYARNIELNVEPSQIELGNVNLGKIGLKYKDRFIQDRFTSLDRINEIEFDRHFNVTGQQSEDETLREVGLRLIPLDQLNIYSEYGFLKRGNRFQSDRFLTNAVLTKDKAYDARFNLDYVSSHNNNFFTDWMRQDGTASYTFWNLKPGLEYLYENKKDYGEEKDSLLTGSLRYLEFTPFIELMNWKGFNFITGYSIREESFPLNGILVKQSVAKTQKYELGYNGIKEFSSTLNFTLRNKEFTDKFKEQGYLDSETILIRSQSRFNFWDRFLNGDLFYEVSTQRSARQEKVFVLVEKGKGNYIYLGDLNNNGIRDENEFEPAAFDGEYILLTVPTDELFPVIDLKTSTRWQSDLSKIIEGDSFIANIIKPVSTETYWRIEENSREENTEKIYMLNFSHFLNDSTTIRGSNLFQQDLFLFKNKRDLSFRFRFIQRENLNQFAGGTERGYYKERGVRIRFQMVEEISNQTDFTNTIDNNDAPVTSNRARQVTTNELSTDFSYRPERDMEFGLVIKVAESRDDFPSTPTVVNINSQTLRMNLNFSGRGRLRFEAERNELNANTNENTIPFEITQGRIIGKNYFWRVNFDYRIASNLQTTLSYDGRVYGNRNVIHTMRAEARAYF